MTPIWLGGAQENVRIIRNLESGGGVTTLLYGGNASLAQVALSEYAALLSLLPILSLKRRSSCRRSVPSTG